MMMMMMITFLQYFLPVALYLWGKK